MSKKRVDEQVDHDEDYIRRRMNKCIHWAGVVGPWDRKRDTFEEVTHCRAGIEYASVEGPHEPDEPGQFNRLPCFADKGGATLMCPARHFSTREEAVAHLAEIREHMRGYFQRIEGGTCPACGSAMTEKQVGPCVYASPCGHRLYQGRAQSRAAHGGDADARP